MMSSKKMALEILWFQKVEHNLSLDWDRAYCALFSEMCGLGNRKLLSEVPG